MAAKLPESARGNPDSLPKFVLKDNLQNYRDFILKNTTVSVNYPVGTNLSRIGEASGRVFFLLAGVVKILTVNQDGYVRILGYQEKNTIFALDCLRPNTSAVVSVKAVSPVKAVPLSQEQLGALIHKNAAFAHDVLLYLGDVLRLMCFEANLQSVNDVRTRLVNFIYRYTKCDAYRDLGYIPLSQDNLASAVNASRVQVARVLADLKQQDLISIGRCKVFVKDPQALGALSGL